MTGWQMALALLAALGLISRLRIGAAVAFVGGALSLDVRVGPLKLSILPQKEKKDRGKGKRKPPKEKRPKAVEQTTKKPKETVGDILSLAMEILPVVGEAAGRLKRKIRIDTLTLHIIWGAPDPAEAALGYGRVNAALGMIWPILDHNFKVKKHDLAVDVEYSRATPEMTAQAAFTMTLGQLTVFGMVYGIKLLMIWSRSRVRSARRQEVQV